MISIQKSQALLNETIAKHQTEAESYRTAIQRQEQMLFEQQKNFEKERRRHNSELNKLRDRADQRKREYDQLRRNDSVSEKTLKAYEEELNKLRKAYEELSERIPTQNSKKSSSCVIS
jgi:chromosome segregation ATPase